MSELASSDEIRQAHLYVRSGQLMLADNLAEVVAVLGRMEKWLIKTVEKLYRLIHTVGGPARRGPN